MSILDRGVHISEVFTVRGSTVMYMYSRLESCPLVTSNRAMFLYMYICMFSDMYSDMYVYLGLLYMPCCHTKMTYCFVVGVHG